MSVLDKLFSPKSVAVIGATESTGVGRSILENLTAVSTRPVYPVNPKRASVLGRRCYPSIADTPERVELAIVVTPAATVPSVIQDCAHLRIPSAIVISAGFREAGPRGQQLERETLKAAQSGGVRLLGPNCLGLMNPHAGLNATFAKGMARPGKLGFISQSGALCSAILDWSQREQVGFSAFVSAGSMSDIGWGDLILHLGDDPHTRAIALYVESIDDARAFASAAREVALSKPIVAIKPGRTQAAARAAASHTGALTGQDEVLDAVFRRCGVLRVDSIAELFDLSEALDMQPRPRGPRLAIVTNAGGPAVLATDAAVLAGAILPELAPATISQLDSFLPAHWSHANPVDVLGDAPPDRFARAVQSALADPNTDGLLAIVAPQAMTDPAETAKQFVLAAHTARKPVLASWMGGDGVAEGVGGDGGPRKGEEHQLAVRELPHQRPRPLLRRAEHHGEVGLSAQGRIVRNLEAINAGGTGAVLFDQHAAAALLQEGRHGGVALVAARVGRLLVHRSLDARGGGGRAQHPLRPVSPSPRRRYRQMSSVQIGRGGLRRPAA